MGEAETTDGGGELQAGSDVIGKEMEVERCRKGGCGKETLGPLDPEELRVLPCLREGTARHALIAPVAMEPVIPAAGMLTCFHVRPISDLHKQRGSSLTLVLSTRVSEWLMFPSHLPYQ